MNIFKHLYPSIKNYLINRSFNSKNIELGRWKIEKCFEKTKIKIDLANNDNCGNCRYYDFSKNNKI